MHTCGANASVNCAIWFGTKPNQFGSELLTKTTPYFQVEQKNADKKNGNFLWKVGFHSSFLIYIPLIFMTKEVQLNGSTVDPRAIPGANRTSTMYHVNVL